MPKKKKLPLGYGYGSAGSAIKKGETYREFVKRYLAENKGASIADAAKAWTAAKKGGGAVVYAKKGKSEAAARLLAKSK